MVLKVSTLPDGTLLTLGSVLSHANPTILVPPSFFYFFPYQMILNVSALSIGMQV